MYVVAGRGTSNPFSIRRSIYYMSLSAFLMVLHTFRSSILLITLCCYDYNEKYLQVC
jgi:hypothetical protein